MHLDRISIPFQGTEPILQAQFVDKRFAEEVIFITDDGNLFRTSIHYGGEKLITNLSDVLELKAEIAIYTYQHYAALVNNRGTKGVVINLADDSVILHLLRGDYNVEHCSYPIGFYSRADKVYLIHGTDWNRLDVTRLEDGKMITERIVEYDKENPTNYLDYFHSLLCVSPDESSFISNGWVWHPFDMMLCWKIEDFLQYYEPKKRSLSVLETSGYNWDRPLCWIDASTIGYGYNALEGNYIENQQVPPSEIIVQRVADNEIIERIPFEGFYLNNVAEVAGTLLFDSQLQAFISYTQTKGVTIANRKGSILFTETSCKAVTYSSQWQAFLQINGAENRMEMVQITALPK